MRLSRRILLGCAECPGWDGASASHYRLFERMQRDGFDVAYVTLVHEADELFLRYQFGEHFGNPRALANVHTCILEEPLWRAHPAVAKLIDSVAPDLLVAGGSLATNLMRWAAPHLPVVFIAAGSQRVEHLIETGAVRDFMGFRRSVARGVTFPTPPDCREQEAAAASALIVVQSPQVRLAFDHFFTRQAGDIYANTISLSDLIDAEAAQFQDLRRPFPDRDIDLIFVASSWSRPEQNYRLVRRIASRCHGLTIHVVGETEQEHFPATYHGVMARREDLYALLGRSKTMVCPSLVDTAPCALFEASAMGCNVIASPNCGNSLLCNEQLLVERCECNQFVSTIMRSRAGVHEDNRARFRGGYEDLVETLSVL